MLNVETNYAQLHTCYFLVMFEKCSLKNGEDYFCFIFWIILPVFVKHKGGAISRYRLTILLVIITFTPRFLFNVINF